MDPKNYQNHTWINLCSLLPIQKVLKSNPIRSSLWLQILQNPSQRYHSSCEILRFVNIIHDILCKTFSIFTTASTYDITRAWQISWFLDFVFFFKNLKIIRPHVRWRVSLTRCSKFVFIFWIRSHTGLNNMNIIFYLFYSIIWITCCGRTA